MKRRDSLKLLAAMPVAAGFTWNPANVERAHAAREAAQAGPAGRAFAPAFFNEHEYETVRVLADLIIPADERSGSATDSGVPEFMDFMMMDRPAMQVPLRGGLSWLDYHCRKQYGQSFAGCSEADQTAVLDVIAWPEQAPPEMSQGVAFFNSFRDLTASGFWSSKMGVEDLQYLGNVFVPEWKGCPQEVLDRLDVEYEKE